MTSLYETTDRVESIMQAIVGQSSVVSFVGGDGIRGTGEAVQLFDPATGKPSQSYGDATDDIVDAAAHAASDAQTIWWAKTATERGQIMHEIGRKIRENAGSLAELESLSAGRPIRDTSGEAIRVAEMFEYYAGWCDKQHGEVIPVPTTHLNYTVADPYGVVVQITPWNAPLNTAGWQVAPAICAGNGVILKPSELTPHSSIVLGYLCEQAGAPRGLVNVLAGTGPTTGQAAVTHPLTRLVVFVGSAAAGAKIAEAAARNVVPCILELGGKSANIIFEDAEIDRALIGSQAAIFGAAGQSCVAGSRLLVHRAVHDAFLERYSEASARIRVGMPMDPKTQMGPINNLRQFEKVDRMVKAAVSQGGQLATGGGTPSDLRQTGGYFYAPTVVAGVTSKMEIAEEEVFGPVVGVTCFDDEEEAIKLSNGTPYGLAGAVWTRDVARAHRFARHVRAGTFWVNSYKTINVMSPFGGFGRSGYGRSSGREALAAYSVTKSIWIETSDDPTISFGYAPE